MAASLVARPSLSSFVCLFATALLLVGASQGDYDPAFRRCAWQCFDEKECAVVDRHEEERLALHLREVDGIGRALYETWHRYRHLSCSDQCMADCSYSVTQERLSSKLSVYKYFGHWSFYRYFGFEEPASVIFSLGNAVPHVLRMWQQHRLPLSYTRCRMNSYKAGISGAGGSSSSGGKCNENSGEKTYFLHDWAYFYPWVATLAWFSSAIYHSKRTKETELLDLSTALILLWYGLAITSRRLAGPHAKSLYVSVLFSLSCSALVWRLSAMTAGQVPFQMHMVTAISIVIASVSLWILWIFTSRDQFDPRSESHRFLVMHLFNYAGSWPNKQRMAFFQVGFIAASMLELFDFPPILGFCDAHSLWHACTIPLGFVWYDFIEEDRAYMLRQDPATEKID